MEPLVFSRVTLVSCLGRGLASHRDALLENRSGLRPCDFGDARLPTWIGRVEGIEDEPVTGPLSAFDCRNNRLARLALEYDGFVDAVGRARARYGSDRIGVFVGSSTSGIEHTEQAYRARGESPGPLPDWFVYRTTHNAFAPADFTRSYLRLDGVTAAIATACSSSAKVFAAAHRAIALGLCDAAVVGGVDSLCLLTLYGFNALELLAPEPCRPWDVRRAGISIGEAAGFALLERDREQGDIGLIGFGESSDGYHMSAPHPDGAGARLAMRAAVARAGLDAGEVDYVNLHGTGTRANDRIEDRAVVEVVGSDRPCSSTKGAFGHTLGASGIVQALVGCLAIAEGFVPGTANATAIDPELEAHLVQDASPAAPAVVLSNSFGFGGSNCSLVLARPDR